MAKQTRIITEGAAQEISAQLENVIAELNGEDTTIVSSSDYTSKDILSEESGRDIAAKLGTVVSAMGSHNAPSFYGTCATAAATTAKVVTCSGFKLKAGRRIAVKFTYSNSASAPTLNVNSTGAIAIKSYGTTAGTLTYRWNPLAVVEFVYDGTNWIMQEPSVATSTYFGVVKATTLNGTANTAPSFYAPTSAGTSGYVLKSNGSGAPTWVSLATISTEYELPKASTTELGGVMLGSDTVQTVAANTVTATASRTYAVQANSSGQMVVNVPWVNTTYTVPTITLNGTANTKPSFYAPTTAGTSGYVLKSNGSGAPTWAEGGADGAEGLSIYRSSTSTSTSTTSITLSTITVPDGRTVKIGDLIIANSTYSYLYRVTAVGSTSATVTYLCSLRGATGTTGTAGIGVYYSTVVGLTTTAYITLSTLTPSTSMVREGELIVTSGGLLFQGTGEHNDNRTQAIVTYLCTLRGADGKDGVDGKDGYYGTCETAAATAAKVVTCSDFVLETGAKINVKFTYYNSASSPTLNVNDTGAITIKSFGTTTGVLDYVWYSGSVVGFVYDGTNWIIQQPAPTAGVYYGLTKVSKVLVNGIDMTSPSFYAPTSAGEAGEVLISDGENSVPAWGALGITAEDGETVGYSGFAIKDACFGYIHYIHATYALTSDSPIEFFFTLVTPDYTTKITSYATMLSAMAKVDITAEDAMYIPASGMCQGNPVYGVRYDGGNLYVLYRKSGLERLY